eukprot:4736013-Alexandrium_andersonii.AAC.1
MIAVNAKYSDAVLADLGMAQCEGSDVPGAKIKVEPAEKLNEHRVGLYRACVGRLGCAAQRRKDVQHAAH